MSITEDHKRVVRELIDASARIAELEAERDAAIRRAEAAETVMLNRTWVAPPMSGWLCPRCGSGNNPATTTCPCSPMPVQQTEIICGSTTR